jgi:cell division protein FtsN
MNPTAPIARSPRPASPRRGGTVLGLLFGIAVGALIALGAAWYVTRHSPFRSKETPPPAPTTLPQELLGMLRQPPPPSANGESAAPSKPMPAPPATSTPSQTTLGASPPATNRNAAVPAPAVPSAGPATTAPAASTTTSIPTPSPSAAAPPTTGAHEASPQRWFWQVGAFGSEQEANRVRAELALLGVTSVAEPAKMPDGRTLYRVRVGPYPSQQAAEAARGRLQAAGYQPVLVRG